MIFSTGPLQRTIQRRAPIALIAVFLVALVGVSALSYGLNQQTSLDPASKAINRQATIVTPMPLSAEEQLAWQYYLQLTDSAPEITASGYKTTIQLIEANRCQAALETIQQLPTYRARQATVSDEEYIKMVYRAILSREASRAEVSSWQASLGQGRVTRSSLLAILIKTPEAETVCANRTLYQP